jgi:CubicO group peptidase (beta-lactamase class C family)
MTLSICLLITVGLFWILVGFSHAVFPRKITVWERGIYRRMRLNTAKKFAKPITKRKVIWVSLQGWLFFLAGVLLLSGLPFQFAIVNNNAILSNAYSISSSNDANSICPGYKAEVDKIISPLISKGKSVGISVGIICGEDNAVFGYGKVELGSNICPNGDTIYEIGSITKVFTAILLADMVENGLVNFNDPARKLLPSSVRVPAYDNTEITLVDLVSHLSALPRIPSNMFRLSDYLSLANFKNPYANYTVQQLYEFLSTCILENKPGTKYNYSNLGMGFLGHVLSQNQKMSFEDMVITRICNRLGMNDTRINLSPEQQRRLAKGYFAILSVSSLCLSFPATNWDMPTLSGAGALRSTVNDMIKFLTGNIGATGMSLTPAMQIAQVPRHKINSRMSIGMAWHIRHPHGNDRQIIWHNGGTGGYRSYMGFNKKYRVGVVILSNSTSSVDEAGINILSTLINYQKNNRTY